MDNDKPTICSVCGGVINDYADIDEACDCEKPDGPCATCKGEREWPECGGPEKECPITKVTSEK